MSELTPRPSTTRVDLAELTPMFELLCAQVGVTTSQGLRLLVTAALAAPEKVDVSWLTQSGGRKYRPTVSYAGAAQREAFIALAQKHHLAEGALLRYLVGKELSARWTALDQVQGFLTAEQGTITPSPDYRVMVGKKDKKGGHSVEIQLRNSEFAALNALSSEQGEKNVQQVCLKIVRAFLLSQPYLGAEVVTKLGQLSLELLRLSNLLAVRGRENDDNTTPESKGFDKELSAALLEAVNAAKAAAKFVSAEVKAAGDRWEIQ